MNVTTRRNTSLTSLALGTTLALASSIGFPVQAAGTTGMATVARATPLRQGDVVKGVLSSIEPMHIVVAVKLRNRDQLDSLIAAHQKLTPEQLAAQYLPTQVQAQTVANYLRLMGYTNIVIAPNRLLVSADGVADNAKAAFLTSFARVQTREGRQAFANTRDAVIPATLQDSVLSVVGLQNVHRARSFAQRASPFAAAASYGVTGHNPTEFASIYQATGLPTAAGVTVGIFAVGDMVQPVIDLNTYTDINSMPRVATQVVYTGGSSSGSTSDVGEWDLDSQTIVGTAGGRVAKLIFYVSPDWNYPGLVATLNAAMSANAAKIINNSWGGCELNAQAAGAAAATDQILAAAVAQGQTFAVSTGDYGANECNPGPGASWPASSPYVVAVAGTTLDASTTTWGSEIVWNAGFGATGGSPSAFEPKPSWQAIVPGDKRGVADVSFSADAASGAKIIVNGGYQQWGGTSLSAPIFAGFWARVIAAKGTAVGFAAPILYAFPATDFHDVTVGNNNGYQAKAGYDFATGRGTLIMSNAITHIGGTAPPPPVLPVANFSYTTNGLIAKFTDSSTKKGGTITTHAWKFGDGGTSRLAYPSHAYLKAGVYRVTETVTDNAGLSAVKSVLVTISR